MGRLKGAGLRKDHLLPKFNGGWPEIAVGDRVYCISDSPNFSGSATVISKVGYRYRVRLDKDQKEFSTDRQRMKLLSRCPWKKQL